MIDKLEAVASVKGFAAAGQPIAAICHRPRSLVQADVRNAKTLTSRPSLHTDIVNGGGQRPDEQEFACRLGGYPLVASRRPQDLTACQTALVDASARA